MSSALGLGWVQWPRPTSGRPRLVIVLRLFLYAWVNEQWEEDGILGCCLQRPQRPNKMAADSTFHYSEGWRASVICGVVAKPPACNDVLIGVISRHFDFPTFDFSFFNPSNVAVYFLLEKEVGLISSMMRLRFVRMRVRRSNSGVTRAGLGSLQIQHSRLSGSKIHSSSVPPVPMSRVASLLILVLLISASSLSTELRIGLQFSLAIRDLWFYNWPGLRYPTEAVSLAILDAGLVQGERDDGQEATGPLHQMNVRKMMAGVDFPDYDYGGANRRHDPTNPGYGDNP
ncbi:hypothetical protein ACLOJK_010335 [Asimina triloba]